MQRQQPSILVSDDDPAVLRLLVTLLKHEGFHVESARDGYEAIEKIALSNFDLIVLDLMMPRVSGLEVIDYLERTGCDAVLNRVIVLTAGSEKDLNKVGGNKVCHVVRKPFDISNLVATIRECVNVAPARDQARREG